MNVIVIGPNPKDPTRNGGVAKYIEYFSMLPLTKNKVIERVNFKGTDTLFLSQIGLKTLGRLLATFCIAFQLLFLDRKNNYVHLNATLSKYGGVRIFLILFVCKIKKIPILTQVHGGRWGDFKKYKFYSSLWNYIFKYSRAVGCFAGPQYNELTNLDVLNNKLVKLANFVPPVENIINKPSDFHFLFLGRLIKEKGIFDIVEAVKILNENKSLVFTVDFVGSGAGSEVLKELNVSNISVLGRKIGIELNDVFSQSHALLLPSYYPEGFPLVFLEGASHQLAAVVTENSAVVEYFEKGSDYLAVGVEDPKQLAIIMEKMITKEYDVTKMGKRLRNKVVKDFSTESDKILEQYVSIYLKNR